MRWTVVLLALAGCGRWTRYESGPEAWPRVVEALRVAPEGQAMLIAGDRAYLVQPDALREDLAALLHAVAEAAEREAQETRPRSAPASGEWDAQEVVAFPRVDRALRVGALQVQSFHGAEGRSYRASVETRRRGWLLSGMRGTPKLERAWEQLVRSARRKARTGHGVVVGLGPEGSPGDAGRGR